MAEEEVANTKVSNLEEIYDIIATRGSGRARREI
jgi:hypothetical protein